MRKFLIAILVLSLFPFASAFAITEGDYVWNDQTITVTAINTTPMFAPAGITSNQRAIAIDMLVSTELWQDDAISDALFAKTRLEDGNGASYAPGAAMSSTKNPTMTYLFAIPKNADIDGLQLVFQSEGSAAASSIPKVFVGTWEGFAPDITLHLTFVVNADGSAQYIFKQGDYTESYDVTLSVTTETFTVTVPEENQLDISTCEGTYQLEGDVLTLNVSTNFKSGRVYKYTVSCTRVDNPEVATDTSTDAMDSVTLTTAAGEKLVLSILADSAFAKQTDTIIVHTRVGTTVHNSGSLFWEGSALTLTNMRNTKQYKLPKAVFSYSISLAIDEAADALAEIAQKTMLVTGGKSYPVNVAWVTNNMACFIFDCPPLGDVQLSFVQTKDILQIIPSK